MQIWKKNNVLILLSNDVAFLLLHLLFQLSSTSQPFSGELQPPRFFFVAFNGDGGNKGASDLKFLHSDLKVGARFGMWSMMVEVVQKEWRQNKASLLPWRASQTSLLILLLHFFFLNENLEAEQFVRLPIFSIVSQIFSQNLNALNLNLLFFSFFLFVLRRNKILTIDFLFEYIDLYSHEQNF